MSYIPTVDTPMQLDASGRKRVSQITTLLDAKALNADDTVIWETVGTGTKTFSANTNQLSVTSGQYLVRQTGLRVPYFSGKSQLVEMTFDGFAYETGVVKRVGYFSSSATAPYDSAFDGWYIESDGVNSTYKIVVKNKGTTIANVDFADWDGYAEFQSYDWDNFTIMMADFLWLGGSELRVFIKAPDGGFKLAHTYRHAGTTTGLFIESPNQPMRYEIRGVSGAGSMTAICGQVGSEGSLAEAGQFAAMFHNDTINVTTGADYVLLGARKTVANRDIPIRLDSMGAVITTNDGGTLMLLKNPTVSGALTWTGHNRHEVAYGNGTQTVTARGKVISAMPIAASGQSYQMTANALTWMGMLINNTPDHYIVAYRPLTANQKIAAALKVIEY